jgi:hypothetical protein
MRGRMQETTKTMQLQNLCDHIKQATPACQDCVNNCTSNRTRKVNTFA